MKRVPKSPAYLWYPKDALSSGRIAELTGLEECWYRRALDHSWLDEGIPSDPVKCARRIGKNCTTKAAGMILKMFFVPHRKELSKMVNLRQEEERKKFRAKIRQRSDAGKVSGRKRRERKGLDAEQPLNGSTNETATFLSPIPIPKEEEVVREEKTEETPQAAAPPKPERRKGTRLSDPFFLTADMKAWARVKRPQVDLTEETEKFCNHFRSVSGQKGVRLDWVLTWKNWILNARGTNGTNQQSNGIGRKDTITDRLGRYDDEVFSKYQSEELGTVD